MRRLFAIAALITATTSVPMAAENTLLDAAERGDRAAVTRLLTKGANPNTPGPDGTTAIMCAAANGDVELVRALIKGGANVKLKNQFDVRLDRGGDHRFGADHRPAAQGRRRSQHEES